tara:strand:+ start:14989 stop:16215 length:1227 start_codon:yes stop_codon:yes gene_type:complete
MKTNTVVITANISKSQIKDTGTHWEIKSIPVTVDDSVMNGIFYPAEENKKGMPTLKGKPVCLSHPQDSEGNYISGREGAGLENYFSGGTITNTYNMSGVNYADASIKKSILEAQDGSDWYANALNSKDSIGVSTGLTIPENNQEGTTPGGDVYSSMAINQEYDHLAMLEPDEDPAGGAATFMHFNSEQKDKIIISNVDDAMKDKITLNKDDATLFNKFKALFGGSNEKDYNVNESGHLAENLNNNREVVNVKNEMMARMKNMGMPMDGVADMSELTMYNAMMDEMDKREKAKNADDMKKKDMDKKDDKMQKNSSDNKLVDLINSLSEKVEGLQGQLNANSADEKTKLIESVSTLATNALDKDVAKHLPVEALKSHLAANGGHLNVNAAAVNYQVNGETHALANMEAPE